MFVPWYCKSIHVFNPLPYGPRAHGGVSRCKHFWLPKSALLHRSWRAVTHVLFLVSTEKEHQMPCTLHPLCIRSRVARLRRTKGALRENVLVAWKHEQIKDQNKIGACTFHSEEFHWRPVTAARTHAWYAKIGNDTVAAAHRVMHSISSYSETWSSTLQRKNIHTTFL